ncbi:MAG: methyltransferase domain-containing protein [Candidatus Omnitrophica bacterium]|nr:methyltransferase domain-containing protein [Candidatus Omnitrophota bacterium]
MEDAERTALHAQELALVKATLAKLKDFETDRAMFFDMWITDKEAMQIIKDPSKYPANKIIKAINIISGKDNSNSELIFPLLGHKDEDVRYAAYKVLNQLGVSYEAMVNKGFIPALRSSSGMARQQAIEKLFGYRNPDCIKPLMDLMNSDSDFVLRKFAADTILTFKGQDTLSYVLAVLEEQVKATSNQENAVDFYVYSLIAQALDINSRGESFKFKYQPAKRSFGKVVEEEQYSLEEVVRDKDQAMPTDDEILTQEWSAEAFRNLGSEAEGLISHFVNFISQARGYSNPELAGQTEILKVFQEILAAFLKTPRQFFVSPVIPLSVIYSEDRPLPIGYGQSNSQPSMVAFFLEEVYLYAKGKRVLEIGSGSGWLAALMSHFVKEVVGVELVPQLTERSQRTIKSLGINNVQILQAEEGVLGHPQDGPYDMVVVSAGAPFESVPQEIIDQIADGGKLLIPIINRELTEQRGKNIHKLVIYTKQGGRLTREDILIPDTSWVPLIVGNADQAMKHGGNFEVNKSDVGGIDMSQLGFNRVDGSAPKIQFNLDAAMLQEMQSNNFTGFKAVITEVTSLESVLPLLGL